MTFRAPLCILILITDSFSTKNQPLAEKLVIYKLIPTICEKKNTGLINLKPRGTFNSTYHLDVKVNDNYACSIVLLSHTSNFLLLYITSKFFFLTNKCKFY